jgi:hypothetical protein
VYGFLEITAVWTQATTQWFKMSITNEQHFLQWRQVHQLERCPWELQCQEVSATFTKIYSDLENGYHLHYIPASLVWWTNSDGWIDNETCPLLSNGLGGGDSMCMSTSGLITVRAVSEFHLCCHVLVG